LKEAKGVWLEMGDNMGHFMDVIFTPSQVNSNPLSPSLTPAITNLTMYVDLVMAPDTRLHTF
jgi:hypothetical protein